MTTTAKRGKVRKSRKKTEHDADQKALVDSFRGSMPDLKLGVDEYLREKHAETDAENAK